MVVSKARISQRLYKYIEYVLSYSLILLSRFSFDLCKDNKKKRKKRKELKDFNEQNELKGELQQFITRYTPLVTKKIRATQADTPILNFEL